jgi:membrane protein DedA with SNARE-associated domain/predicted ATP-grasp superfamily ATP-dependent carboligase
VFPGEWVILMIGAVAGEGGIPIVPLLLLVWACSLAGDSIAYAIGRRFGRAFLLRSGARLGVTEARLRRADRWFAHYGAGALALGRLVPFVRPTAPLLAGATAFPYRRFLAWNSLGTALFTLTFCLLGYFFYRSYDQVAATAGRGGLAAFVLLVAAAIAVSRRRRRARDARQGLRVLLSDGSGLTARQVATRLGEAGHDVLVASPDRLCLARWTRHVRRVQRVPPYGHNPLGWLEAVLEAIRRDEIDVLFPTQEQAALLSRELERVRGAGAATAVPPFDALARVQDKLSAQRTLAELGLPQPPSSVARTPEELLATERLPAFVKTPIGTATAGIRHVRDRPELERAAGELAGDNAFVNGGVLVQQPAEGPLVMVQAVFRHGRLEAAHANERLRLGARGGASGKRSVPTAPFEQHLGRLGEALRWHGALSLDAVLSAERPLYIDVNPRLVEPGNAWRAGVDLVDALLRVARDQPSRTGRSRVGVATHQLLIALLGAAEQGGGRRGVVRELAAAARRRGPYRDSAEELTPLAGDAEAAVPLAAVSLALLAAPRLWRVFASGAVASYALTPVAWERIRAE